MKALKADQSPCAGSTHGERIAWLFAIQENLLRDKYDEQFAKKRDPSREVDVVAMQRAFVESTADFVAQGQAGGPSPSEDAAQREEHEILAKLLAQLPAEYRKARGADRYRDCRTTRSFRRRRCRPNRARDQAIGRDQQGVPRGGRRWLSHILKMRTATLESRRRSSRSFGRRMRALL
jgi:hypothetical protein